MRAASSNALRPAARQVPGAPAWLHCRLQDLIVVHRPVLRPAQTYFTFEDTLSQIGLGYVALFWLGLRPEREQWIALVALLAGYWAAFALYPLPGPGFDWARPASPPTGRTS